MNLFLTIFVLSTLAIIAPNMMPIVTAADAATSALANGHGETESGDQAAVSRNLQRARLTRLERITRRRCRNFCRVTLRGRERRECLAECDNPPSRDGVPTGPQRECLRVSNIPGLSGDWPENNRFSTFRDNFNGFSRGQLIRYVRPTDEDPNAYYVAQRVGVSAEPGNCTLPDPTSRDIELCNGIWVDVRGNVLTEARFNIEPSLCMFF